MRLGVVGYGRLGAALERQLISSKEDELVAIFTRRPPHLVKTLSGRQEALADALRFTSRVDCLLIAQGSALDVPELTPSLCRSFSVVDSYDNHSDLSRHIAECDRVARASGNLAVVGAGWDPGLLSVIRTLSAAVLPSSPVHTFWGEGVSQGHSEAVRHIDGVIDAVQYTVPNEAAIKKALSGETTITKAEKHKRVCYIAAEKEKEEQIRSEVINMPEYFLGYETEVFFVSSGELHSLHSSLSHRGRVISVGKPYPSATERCGFDFSLFCGSNPELTASIMLSAAHALERLKARGCVGALSLPEIPPSLLCEDDTYLSLL